MGKGIRGALAGLVWALAANGALAQRATETNAGYIDAAVPFTHLRLRSDFGYNNRSANRAEFIYPQPQPLGPGLPRLEPRIDTQDLSAYLEYAAGDRFSAFAEVPWRLINPEVNDNSGGLSDVSAGFKWALLAEQDGFLTFQLRTYAPSGDADRGLGTRHVSLEPALLANTRLGEGSFLEGELRYWVPVGGTDFAGSVLRYGLGLSQHVYDRERLHVIPMAELIGWTALSGKVGVATPGGAVVRDAGGDTILNARVGVRARLDGLGDAYLGYGRALTGDRWYSDEVRLEFRLTF